MLVLQCLPGLIQFAVLQGRVGVRHGGRTVSRATTTTLADEVCAKSQRRFKIQGEKDKSMQLRAGARPLQAGSRQGVLHTAIMPPARPRPTWDKICAAQTFLHPMAAVAPLHGCTRAANDRRTLQGGEHRSKKFGAPCMQQIIWKDSNTSGSAMRDGEVR